MGRGQKEIEGRFGISARLMGVIGIITLTTVAIVCSAILTLKGQESDATIVNVAGRQRMLSQKMTKESLAIAANLNAEANREALQKTYQLFDKSHQGLIRGNPEMQLPPTTDPATLKQMMHVDALWKKFSVHVRQVIEQPNDSPLFKSSIVALLGSNVELLKEMNKGVGLYEQWCRGKVDFLKGLLLSGLAFALLITGGCWLLISRKVARPIQQVSGMIQELEKGHLDRRLGLVRKDEIGMMAKSMDSFADSLRDEVTDSLQRLANGDLTFDIEPRDGQDVVRGALQKLGADLNELVSQIKVAGTQIASGSGQVSDSSQSLSQGATESAASLEQLSSSMTQLASQTRVNAENAGEANRISVAAKEAAEKGNTQMQSMVAAMSEINEAGQNIGKIIKVIDEIAFQTNLLALNAAVEAARAGQHGKGFAVVAEEVRNLAARSAKAARETADLIEGSVQKAEGGAEIADRTAAALDEIVGGITKATDLVAEIAAASTEQAQGISEINQGLDQIDQVTQQNTACAEESAAAAEELSSQSDHLDYMLQRFRIKEQIGFAPGMVQLEAPAPVPAAEGWPKSLPGS